MFDKNDIAVLQGMFQDQDARLRVVIRDAIVQNNTDLKREIREEVRSLLAASESRINATMDEKMNKMESRLNSKIEAVTSGVAEIIGDSILPQIADLQKDMTRVKTHLQLA